MTADNPNARSQSARRQRLTQAAQMAGFETIDQLAKAITSGEYTLVYSAYLPGFVQIKNNEARLERIERMHDDSDEWSNTTITDEQLERLR